MSLVNSLRALLDSAEDCLGGIRLIAATIRLVSEFEVKILSDDRKENIPWPGFDKEQTVWQTNSLVINGETVTRWRVSICGYVDEEGTDWVINTIKEAPPRVQMLLDELGLEDEFPSVKKPQ